ncbi:unnamed protein product [Closterium sp. Naga37s-1]|nr:unnamed protein product [Closterium sp. Naga37s-1]
MAPSATRESLKTCRPVVALDGTFLIRAQKATLLYANAMDGNQQIIPIAWALVESETKDTWTWFCRLFDKHCSDWKGRDDAAIISDRDKGLIPAVKEVFPEKVAHYFCGWHMQQNVKRFGKTSRGHVMTAFDSKVVAEVQRNQGRCTGIPSAADDLPLRSGTCGRRAGAKPHTTSWLPYSPAQRSPNTPDTRDRQQYCGRGGRRTAACSSITVASTRPPTEAERGRTPTSACRSASAIRGARAICSDSPTRTTVSLVCAPPVRSPSIIRSPQPTCSARAFRSGPPICSTVTRFCDPHIRCTCTIRSPQPFCSARAFRNAPPLSSAVTRFYDPPIRGTCIIRSALPVCSARAFRSAPPIRVYRTIRITVTIHFDPPICSTRNNRTINITACAASTTTDFTDRRA